MHRLQGKKTKGHARRLPFYKRFAYWFIAHEHNNHTPRALHHHSLAWYGIGLIAVKAVLSISLFLSFPDTASFSSLTSQRIIDLTNAVRSQAGLSPLRENPLLDLSATYKVDDMAHGGYFAHTSPQGISPWKAFQQAGYEYTYAGENLAMDFVSAEDVVDAWMASPKHRENIMNPKYEDIGIAVATGTINGNTVTLVVQHFGKTHLSPPSQEFLPSRPLAALPRLLSGNASVASAHTAVTMQKKEGITLRMLSHYHIPVIVFVFILATLLIVNSFIHYTKRIRPWYVYSGIFIMALSLSLLLVKVHFLEKIGQGSVVIW